MIEVTEKKVPHLFRNKYLRNAGNVNISNLPQLPGTNTPGASVDIVKTDNATIPTDSNVLSSLRALLEIRSRIIASTDDETALSEDNTLSSLRTIAEIDAAIASALKDIEKLYLSKTKSDTAAEAITFLKGLFVGDNLAHIDANGDAEVKNLVARMKAKVATLEVTGAASVDSITVGQTATTLNLLVQELADAYDLNVSHVATMFRTIIKDYVSSETFIPGLTGEGMKIHKALNGDWNLEIDNVVVRKVMTIFELVISKLRSVNGGLVVSAANGRIKSVGETTGEPTYYVLGIEGDMQFVADDLVRCQVFTSGQMKFYWVPVASVTADSILVLKSEFPDGVFPVSGDDLIQMGNLTNKARQGVLYLTASEDGKPRFSVLDGVNSTSTVGKSKVILGCLDGITDTDFPADFQPSGYGLYAMNVFLKGVFILRNGKNVEDEVNAAKDAAQDAKDKADTVTRLFQEFTVAGGLFESKITEVKTYTDNKVDEVQVGGRNLYRKSTPIDSQGTSTIIETEFDSDSINGFRLTGVQGSTTMVRIHNLISHNGNYVVSFWGKSNNVSTPRFDMCDISLSGDSTFTTEWKKFELKVSIRNYTPDVYKFVDIEGLEFLYYWFKDFKVEEGNKATDWTPAPEDVQSQIDTHGTAIQQNAKAIQLKASQTTVDGLGNRLSTAEGTLGVQAGQIAAQVSNVSALTGRMSSAEFNLRPENIWLGIKGSVDASIPKCTTQVDTRSLDPNKYYLLTIAMSVVVPYTITVRRNLDRSWGIPHYSTHSEGFSVLCKWQCNGSGWGCITPQRTVHTFAYSYSTVCPVGSISQINESSEEYIYVRGGSLYEVHIDGTSSTPVTLHTTTHTPRPDYPSTSRQSPIDSVEAPVPDLNTKVTEEQIKAGIGITDNGITVFGKFIDFTGRITFNSMSADAQNRIISAQNTANDANTGLTTLRNSLGGLAYDNAVNIAKLDSTIIEGGYIKTNLINARAIVTGSLIVEQIAAGSITADKIRVADLEVTKLKGATGSFKKLTCVSNSNQEVGAIEFGSDGKMWFSGDIYHQGYNSTEGRSHRFYASDLWCRGEFGHYCMTKLEYSSGYTNDVFFHIYNYGVDTAYHKYAKPGQPIDCIVLNGSANYVAYVCDSSPNKMVTIVNASGADKRIKLNNSGATETVLAYSFKAVVTGQSHYFNGFYINDLLVMR